MACKYTYKGNEYTRGQILDQIMKGGLSLQLLDQQKARETIKRITGMTDAQIEFIKGLIDGKALGRMLSDGRILLSEMASESTAYHEAFHRVWQGSLTSEERNAAIREFKTNKNWERLIEPYRASYGDDVDVRIEEYFADEFANFVLGEPTPKTFLQKLFAQLKKMLDYLGLTKPSEINRIYDLMNKGAYAAKQQSYQFKERNSIVLKEGGQEIKISSDDYLSFLESLHLSVMKDVAKEYSIVNMVNSDPKIKAVVEANVSTKIKELVQQMIKGNDQFKNFVLLEIPGIKKAGSLSGLTPAYVKENYPNVSDMFDFVYFLQKDLTSPKSQLKEKYNEYYSNLIEKLNVEKTQDTDILESAYVEDETILDEEAVENAKDTNETLENQSIERESNEYGKASFEIDSNNSISNKIKFLLSLISDPNSKSKFGLQRSYNWVAFANFLNNNLANIPATEEDIFGKLKQLEDNTHYGPGISQLIDLLGGEKITWNGRNENNINLRIEFISHFAQNKYNFYVTTFTENNIYTYDAGKLAVEDKVKNAISTKFILRVSEYLKPMDFIEELRKIRAEESKINSVRIAEMFGLTEERNSLSQKKKDEFDNAIKNIGETIFLKIEDAKTFISDEEIFDMFSGKKDNYFDISGYFNKIARIIGSETATTELSVLSATGSKLYAISLNSYMTQVVNEINYALEAIEKLQLDEQERKEELLRRVPQLNTPWFDASLWLNGLLEEPSRRLKIIINDGVKSMNDKTKRHLSDLNETDLYSVYINQMLSSNVPIWQMVKHSDRNILYGIAFDGPKDAIKRLDYTGEKEQLKDIAEKYLKAELKKLRLLDEGVGRDVQNYNKTSISNSIFGKRIDSKGNEVDVIPKKDYQKLLDLSKEVLKTNVDSRTIVEYEKQFEKAIDDIVKSFEDMVKKERDQMDKHMVLRMHEGKPIGISQELWENVTNQAKEYYPNAKKEEINNRAIDFIVELYAINSWIGNIEQTIFITGDPNLYKSSSDSFKRFSVWSSTGNLSVTGDMVNSWILGLEQNEQIEFLREPFKYNETEYGKNPNYIASLTFAEEKYEVDPETLQEIKERSYKSAKAVARVVGFDIKKSEEIASGISESSGDLYAQTNEPDGQSYNNLFEWRRTKIRWGQWSARHQRLFQMELDILNGKKTFEIPTDSKDAYVYLNEFLGLAETIKGQYAGPYWTNTDRSDPMNVQGVAKTSFYPLLPSQILGTKLEQLNKEAIKKGVGAIHIASARKLGVRILLDENMKPVNNDLYVNGLPKAFNSNGDINLEMFEEESKNLNRLVQYMEAKYYKHQTAISNREKDTITSSTQSYKINISNLFNEGVPIDYVGKKENWDNMEEAEKRNASEIYKNVGRIVDITTKRVRSAIFEIEQNVLGNTNMVINYLKDALKQRNASKNILEALDAFEKAETKILELIPNKGRIEPVIYSLIKSRVLTQERNGNSVPQVTSLWWDPIGKNRRTNEKGQVVASEELKMYTDGKNYAEVMMPIPTKWLNSLMKAYNTRDLIRLTEMINQDIANNNFTRIDEKMLLFKGLRIPNQQTSSNDVFRVKKFLVPSNTAMIVVPPLIAVKVGSDFDIDKVNQYLPKGMLVDGKFSYVTKDLIEQKFKEERNMQGWTPELEQQQNKRRKMYDFALEENELLSAEIKLLTMEINYFNLMRPTDDTMWKDDAKNKIEDLFNDNKKNESAIIRGYVEKNQMKSLNIFDVYTGYTNIEKTRENIGSKDGIGIVAKAITNHVLNQAYNFNVSEYIAKQVGKDVQRKYNQIPFVENKNFGKIFSIDGKLISDNLSGLLTSQLDMVKDAYAKFLNLQKSTLNVVNYLLEKGVAVDDISYFLTQPIIKDYLDLESVYNSSTFKEGMLRTTTQKDLKQRIVNEIKSKYAISKDKRKELEDKQEPSTSAFLINSPKFFSSVIKTFDFNYQNPILDVFLDLKDQAEMHFDVMRATGIDTFKPSSKSDVREFNKNKNNVLNTNFVKNIQKSFFDNRNNLMSPFIRVQNAYEKLESLYLEGEFKGVLNFDEMLDQVYTRKNRERMAKALPEQFITFLVQNYDPLLQEKSFDNIMVDANKNSSLAKRLLEFKRNSPKKYRVLDALFTMLRSKKALGKKLSHVKKIDLSENKFQLEEYSEELKELYDYDPNLFKDILAYTIYTYGYSASTYSLDRLLPIIDEANKIKMADKAILKFKKESLMNQTRIVNSFKEKFYLANPQLLPKLPIKDGGLDMEKIGKAMTARMKSYQSLELYYRYFEDGRYVIIKAFVAEGGKLDQAGYESHGGIGYMFYNYSTPLDVQYVKLDKASETEEGNSEDETSEQPPLQQQGSISAQPTTPSATETINIYAGTRENAELSNFANRPFTYSGKDLPNVNYKSVEIAYQLAKISFASPITEQNLEVQEFLNNPNEYSSAQAKSLGSKIKGLKTKEWDSNSSRIMKDLIKQSFEQNPDAAQRLLATGNATLTHTQDKGKWGTEFPRLLMEVREELRLTTPSVSTVDKARPEFSKLPAKSATPTMTYAGIGSRETPPEILAQMTELAKELESKGYTLRSGGAQGADTAFEKGVSAKKEIFPGSKIAGEREMKIAREIHPNPQALDNSKSPAFTWNLMARNTNQVFGENLDTPVDFVIAWTQDALTDYRQRSIKSGGTGQAIDMASRKGIPIINMANENWREQLNAVLSVSTGTTAPDLFNAVQQAENDSIEPCI